MQEMRYQKRGDCDVVRHGAMTHMVVMLTLTAVLGVIGFLAAGTVARSATRTTGTVSLRKTKLGLILVNSRGHTLYLFAKERNGKSACSGSCAKFWPPSLQRVKPDGWVRRESVTARHNQAQQRQPAADLQQTPALQLRARQAGRSDKRRRQPRLRRQVVRRLRQRNGDRQGFHHHHDHHGHHDDYLPLPTLLGTRSAPGHARPLERARRARVDGLAAASSRSIQARSVERRSGDRPAICCRSSAIARQHDDRY